MKCHALMLYAAFIQSDIMYSATTANCINQICVSTIKIVLALSNKCMEYHLFFTPAMHLAYLTLWLPNVTSTCYVFWTVHTCEYVRIYHTCGVFSTSSSNKYWFIEGDFWPPHKDLLVMVRMSMFGHDVSLHQISAPDMRDVINTLTAMHIHVKPRLSCIMLFPNECISTMSMLDPYNC